MNVRYIDTIIGFSIPKRELYYHCLMHDEEFRSSVDDQVDLHSDDEFDKEELYEFARTHTTDLHLNESIKEQRIDDLIHETMFDLSGRTYPGTSFTIFINHAEEAFNEYYDYFIVGVKVLGQLARNTQICAGTSDGGLGLEAVDEMNRLLVATREEFRKNTDLAASKRELKLFTILGGY